MSLGVGIIDTLFVVTYLDKGNPTDEEWRAYLEKIELSGVDKTRHIVFTEGGAPSYSQGESLARVIGGVSVPFAIVSENSGVRARVSAIDFMGREVRSFPPSRVAEALEYLHVPVSRVVLVESAVRKFRIAARKR
jgi:hypothetical protein